MVQNIVTWNPCALTLLTKVLNAQGFQAALGTLVRWVFENTRALGTLVRLKLCIIWVTQKLNSIFHQLKIGFHEGGFVR